MKRKTRMFIYVQEFAVACIDIPIERTTATLNSQNNNAKRNDTHDMIHDRARYLFIRLV